MKKLFLLVTLSLLFVSCSDINNLLKKDDEDDTFGMTAYNTTDKLMLLTLYNNRGTNIYMKLYPLQVQTIGTDLKKGGYHIIVEYDDKSLADYKYDQYNNYQYSIGYTIKKSDTSKQIVLESHSHYDD